MIDEPIGVEPRSMSIRVSDRYRRAELEKTIWHHRLDGISEETISDLVGIPERGVKTVLSRMLESVQNDASAIARTWAMRQTMALWSEIYEPAREHWEDSKDPRYAEQMRGALSDIRKIWGVDSVQRVELSGSLTSDSGILGGILDELEDSELAFIERIFVSRGRKGPDL